MAAKNARHKRRCKKKVGHRSEKAANTARQIMYRQNKAASGRLAVYRCPYCGKFHVGRKKMKHVYQ